MLDAVSRYREQQYQVAALAALVDLPQRQSVTAVFIDQDNKIVDELDYGKVQLLT